MEQDFIATLRQIVEADKRLSKSAAEGFRMMAEAMRTRQKAFDEKKNSVKEEIDRGSRLTKHRISL
ncbi:hypothetical protein KDW65_35605 [Burkholderia cenocepacia]|uniref:hypothetical protein n=1 Tax=Burkholderia cenocepacia TaxID=95486 RepID=UPI001B9BA920|nr:hypothetical protein [Burkholderia cenocepacia]MBR8401960.1 hypothetical protein [Burkholderia cenocepacia]